MSPAAAAAAAAAAAVYVGRLTGVVAPAGLTQIQCAAAPSTECVRRCRAPQRLLLRAICLGRISSIAANSIAGPPRVVSAVN